MRWFKHYVDASIDEKLVKVALSTGQPLDRVSFCWMRILESAACGDGSGEFDMAPDYIAWIIRSDVAPVRSIFEAFEQVGLIADSRAIKWVTRQQIKAPRATAAPDGDERRSTDRVRAFRDRARGAQPQAAGALHGDPRRPDETHQPLRNAGETLRNADETLRNADETPSDSRVRGETESKSSNVVVLLPREAAPAPIGVIDEERVYRRLIEGTGGAISQGVASCGVAEVMSWLNGGFDLELDVLPMLAGLRLAEPLRTLKAAFLRLELVAFRESRLAPPAPPAPSAALRVRPRVPPGLLGSVSPAALDRQALQRRILGNGP